jgi:hypothetical protein
MSPKSKPNIGTENPFDIEAIIPTVINIFSYLEEKLSNLQNPIEF